MFVNQFIEVKTNAKSSTSLMSVIQMSGEFLRDYLNLFTKETLRVPNLDQSITIVALADRTTNEHLKVSLIQNPPTTIAELQRKAGKYMVVEDIIQSKSSDDRKRKNDVFGNKENNNGKRPRGNIKS